MQCRACCFVQQFGGLLISNCKSISKYLLCFSSAVIILTCLILVDFGLFCYKDPRNAKVVLYGSKAVAMAEEVFGPDHSSTCRYRDNWANDGNKTS
jgi:hypothetical protein